MAADVNWGKEPGKFDSKVFCRVEFSMGKISYIKLNWNPLHFLYAVGADVPVFKMDLNNPRIDAYLKEQSEAPAQPEQEEAPLDTSYEAVKQRIQNNLESFTNPDFWTGDSLACYAPDCASTVWFLPPEMKESYPAEMMPRVQAWSCLSSTRFGFGEGGRYWETDDPHVYFCEYMGTGPVEWIGNNAPNAYYRNRYFYVLRFDDLGRITDCEEVMNPINKFNSIGVSIPSFPYYFH